MLRYMQHVPDGSIIADVGLNPAKSSDFLLVLVSLQQAPHSVTVHPVLVAESHGREEELAMMEISLRAGQVTTMTRSISVSQSGIS